MELVWLLLIALGSSGLLTIEPARGQSRSEAAWELASLELANSNGNLEKSQAGSLSLPADYFNCVQPSHQLFLAFINQTERRFLREEEALRSDLFHSTLQRTILVNRVIQNEVLNASLYKIGASNQLGNLHFIKPFVAPNQINMFYIDITDCELGIIKNVFFNILQFIDNNKLELAYKKVIQESGQLPLLSARGWQQLAEILIVRLYDRFRGDRMISQLFNWPTYLRKLAAFVYNRRQVAQADWKSKLPFVALAYPAFFTDLRYHLGAINRTNDNLRMHQEHERFNSALGRQFASREERNRRLASYRQRKTLIELLNEVPDRWRNLSLPESELPQYQLVGAQPDQSSSQAISERLRLEPELWMPYQDLDQDPSQWNGPFRQTQFSDLSDAEFAAYLSGDYSLLGSDQAAISFIERNFPVAPLDDRLRDQIALELELRRPSSSGKMAAGQQQNLELARRTLDELITEVGLPIGPIELANVNEKESISWFARVARQFGKVYLDSDREARSEEGQLRLKLFKQNYAKFRAWWLKEGWTKLDERQSSNLLRLADMSWPDIKLLLFKLCCLKQADLSQLQQSNQTLAYLASNQYLCEASGHQWPNNNNDLLNMELYYYYSVHFSKHHLSTSSFERHFQIFQHNLRQMRELSCERSLTLFSSLEMRVAHTFNTIDQLDSRRLKTDDINLDRFKYFELANLDLELEPRLAASGATNLDEAAVQQANNRRLRVSQPSSSRATISYRRAPFADLLDLSSAGLSRPAAPSASTTQAISNGNQATGVRDQYRELKIGKVYNLVHQRIRVCMQLRQIELPSDFEQEPIQCNSHGRLADQTTHHWKLDLLSRLRNGPPISERIVTGGDSPSSNNQARHPNHQCGFYKDGLDSWSDGLIGQQGFSVALIGQASCAPGASSNSLAATP